MSTLFSTHSESESESIFDTLVVKVKRRARPSVTRWCPQDPKENSFPAQKGTHEANLMLECSNRSEASPVGGPSMYVCRKVKKGQARTGHHRRVWVDAGQMMTTRTRATHRHKQAHKTHSQRAATHPELAYT